MKRFFDIFFSLLGLFLGSPVLIIIYLIGIVENGSPLFRQEREGKDKKLFIILKFRTMHKDTAWVASHLAKNSSITFFGKFLRKTKLDELPQLWNVLKGEMSLVGPRPNLFNQIKLIKERDILGIYNVRPGITGLAQINKIDMSNPILLAKTDNEMITSLTISNYFKYIFATLRAKGAGDRVKE